MNEVRLIDLPPIPVWFSRELENIERVNGKPLFKIVDGQREMAFRNGKMDVKYLLQSDGVPCYIRIPRVRFRRKNAKGEFTYYPTYEAAEADKTKGLFKLIERGEKTEVRAVGRPCYVIEAYNSPAEISYDAWSSLRYQWWENAFGVVEKIDVLGEYPTDGRYIFCLDVIDSEGNAIAPHRGIIEDLKRRKWEFENDRRSYEQAVKDAEEAQARFERKAQLQIIDNFYQEEGISAKRLEFGAVFTPPTKTKI